MAQTDGTSPPTDPANHDDPTETAAVVPPSPVSTHVDAPRETERRIRVLLELLVDQSGAVTESRILDGPSEFAEAALQASRSFVFEPARRLGKPVAARIRFLVRFEPKQLEPPPPAPPATKVPTPHEGPRKPAEATTEPDAPLEVTVGGVRPAYTTGIITRTEAREMPGTFGDPLRAIEASSGVTPAFSGVPYFFVRGAPPGNVGFFLDGIRVPLLYHALLGPSVIHPGLVDHIELYRGAAPARFGRYAGAIVSAETRAPLTRFGGEANIRLFDAGGLAEAPLANGRGHVLVGGRYSYTALAASLLSDAELQYWDYQARADWDTGGNGRLSLFVFGAFDNFAANDGVQDQTGGVQFHRIDLRHDVTTARTQSRVAVTFGYDRTTSTSGYLHDRLVAFRSGVTYRASPEVSFSAGHDVMVDSYEVKVDSSIATAADIATLFPSRTDLTGGMYGELTLAPAKFVTIAPGVRTDVYRVGHQTAMGLDARVSTSWHPGRGLHAYQSLGFTNQPPNYVPQIPSAQVGTLNGGLQHAIQASSGFTTDLFDDMTLGATVFRSQFFDLLDPIGRDHDLSFDPGVLTRRERGSSIGLEMELRRPLSRRVGGFVSYTLSRTERSHGTRESLSAFDRPHVLQGALSFDLGRRFRAGARVAYYSGLPARLIRETADRSVFVGDRRAPGFFRTDLRLEKRWPIAGRGYWALVAEMLNATLSREVTSRNCKGGSCTDEYSGPVAIPSIGVEMYSY